MSPWTYARRLLSPERVVRNVLGRCDIQIDGDRPWDMKVHDSSFHRRLALDPGFELGETYMDGLWDCSAIDEMLFRLVQGGVAFDYQRGFRFAVRSALARVWNRQSVHRASQVADRHYDLGTDLYEAMLDSSMTYTCAYWDSARSLEEAQTSKLRMICEKLALKPGERLLDIGCGFGGLAAFAATHYGVSVLGITNSRHHQKVASERCAHLPSVEIALMDYRELETLGKRFDKVSAIEMIEAVGPKNYRRYMEIVKGCLKEGGRFLLQTFVSHHPVQRCNEWFDRYIFPNGVSPSLSQLDEAATPSLGAPVGQQDIGTHYAPTLMAWDTKFEASWDALSARYPERFRRMWHFYLTCLAGIFRAQGLGLYQIVWVA